MARQEETCWRCGTEWAPEGRPALQLIAGAADADRRRDDGGSFASEVTLPLPATAAAR